MKSKTRKRGIKNDVDSKMFKITERDAFLSERDVASQTRKNTDEKDTTKESGIKKDFEKR